MLRFLQYRFGLIRAVLVRIITENDDLFMANFKIKCVEDVTNGVHTVKHNTSKVKYYARPLQ